MSRLTRLHARLQNIRTFEISCATAMENSVDVFVSGLTVVPDQQIIFGSYLSVKLPENNTGLLQ